MSDRNRGAPCASRPLSRTRERLGAEYAAAALILVSTPFAAQADDPFERKPHLERAELVAAVLERNPGLEAARRGWEAAQLREPQVTALDDPMASYMIAPLSVGSAVPFGQTAQISQRLPFPGKRGLRGALARAEADAARGDFEAVKLELALAASLGFDDYLVVIEALEINREHARLLEDLRESAQAQYVAGRGSQQDALQAEVELARIESERIDLDAQQRVIVARLNALLHRPPERALPPPVKQEPVVETSESLLAQALEQRPELQAIRARIEGAERRRELARRESYPDFEVMTSYNDMWMMTQHYWMLGVGLNIPLQLGRRRAAVQEAESLFEAETARLARSEIEIRSELRQALDRTSAARDSLAVFETRLVPTSSAQVEAARAGFIAGRNSFVAVIDAERNLRNARLGATIARAELNRRLAELARAAGRMAGLNQGGTP